MECLYCDAELKPFRGLFDEDFCCRDHRDKYFSSFRKSLNRLPALLTPVAGPVEPPSLPVSQPDEPVFSAHLPRILTDTPALPHTETLSAADDRDEPAGNPFSPPLAIPVEPEAPVPLATYTVGEPAEPSDVDSEETPFGPPAADFLPVSLAALAGAQSVQSTGLNALPASYAIEFPAGVTTWAASLALEQRPAELLDLPEAAAANAFVPMPAPLELSTENPAFAPAAPVLPESEECAAHAPSQGAFGYASPWNYADPLTTAPLALALAPFSPAADGAAWMPTAEFADLVLACHPLASSTIAAPEIMLAHQFHTPVFTPSAELADEERDEFQAGLRDVLPADPAPSEIAPALLMNSSPLDSPAFMPARAAEMMPPALAFSSAASPLSSPGLASTFDGQPSLAPELMADIPQSPAANQPAQPRSHAPLRQLFGSSVRIKNWRLRITFAKPA